MKDVRCFRFLLQREKDQVKSGFSAFWSTNFHGMSIYSLGTHMRTLILCRLGN